MHNIDGEMREIAQAQAIYRKAVTAIEKAALAGNHGKELTGEGIDKVRADIAEEAKAPSTFSAARGQKGAAA